MKNLTHKSFKVSLASGEGKVRRALICRTGTFKGIFGQVTVTREMLLAMVDKYKLARAEPANENDYAPILKNHVRDVENVCGRLLPENMSVENWKVVDSRQEFGLYADLRIDEDDALAKVKSGKYAHLSVTFDDETNEIEEVSFVPVEAARGAIVLAKGDTMKKKKQLAAGGKKTSLSLAIANNRKNRVTMLAAHKTQITSLSTELNELVTKSTALSATIKEGQLKNQFVAIVRQGKMNPAELKDLDIKSLSALPATALTAVLKSYESRAVSSDVFQHGQSGQDQSSTSVPDKEKMRELIELQKAGKTSTSLAQGENKDENKTKMTDDEKKEAEKLMKSYSMSEEEMKKCLADMDEISTKMAGLSSSLKAMSDKVDEMESEDKKAEDSEKLAAEEDEKESLASEEDDKDDDEDKDK